MNRTIRNESNDSSDLSPLVAAYSGSMDFLVPFLNAGGCPSYADNEGQTLLHAAADGWQFHAVEFLMMSGAKVNAQTLTGDTPLHTVTQSRTIPYDGLFLSEHDLPVARSATFQALLLRGADRVIRNAQGACPLHIAAWFGDLDAINALAQIRTIDEQTSKGATALALAILNNHVDCARRLIQLNASLTVKMPSGHCPMDYLLSSENSAMRELLHGNDKPPSVGNAKFD